MNSSKRKLIFWTLGAVAALALIPWGVSRLKRMRRAAAPAAAPAGAPQSVGAFEVRTSSFTDAIDGLIGTIRGDTIELGYAGFDEPLTAVHVRVGQRVKKDELLFEIDHVRAEARKNQAEVAYERAREMHAAGASTAMDLKEAKSAFDIAQRDYDDTFLRAPKAGFVSEIRKQVGEMVGRDAGSTVGVLVSSQDRLFLETAVIESHVDRVKPGQRVEVDVEAVGPPSIIGTVDGVSREVSTTGRTGTVVVALPADAQKKLRPGMSAACRILTFDGEALMIPRQAFDREKNAVYVIIEGKAVRRPVTLGYVAPDHYQVAEGLAEGDLIVRDLIINPVDDGAAVTVEGRPERLEAPVSGR